MDYITFVYLYMFIFLLKNTKVRSPLGPGRTYLAPKGLPKGHQRVPKIIPKSVLQPEGPHGVPQTAQKSKMNPKWSKMLRKLRSDGLPPTHWRTPSPSGKRHGGGLRGCAVRLIGKKTLGCEDHMLVILAFF